MTGANSASSQPSGRPGSFRLRRAFARIVLRLARWHTTGELPRRAILVGAPHTSNLDWLFSLLLCWNQRIAPTIMIKKELFKGPLGALLRATGGVALDRKDPGETVRSLIAAAAERDDFLLAIAPEGTRGKTEYWKSGFYRIAQQTGLPIALGFVDGPTRTVGVGPTFAPTGNVAADMDKIREFYADKHGINSELRGEPRLRDETPGTE